MRNITWLGASAACVALGVAGTADALPSTPYIEVNQRGGFLMIGNSQGYDCSLVDTPQGDAGDVPSIPLLEGMQDCDAVFGSEPGRLESPAASDTSLDLFWTLDGAEAYAQQVDPTAAISGAMLRIPDSATITHAQLYWAGYLATEDDSDPVADSSVEVTFPTSDGSGSVKVIESSRSWVRPNGEYHWYQSTADVTAAVQGHGSGLYLVTDLETSAEAHEANDDLIAAWWLAVLYEDAGAEVVNLRLYDGLDVIGANEEGDAQPAMSLALNGLPARGNSDGATRLGVVGYEGDARLGGDYIRIGQTPVSNGLNPPENFFNGTRSLLGQSGTDEGDVPFLPGTPRSISGLDIDVVDVADLLAAGGELPTIHAGSYFERYLLAGLVTQVPVNVPLIDATMTVEDDGSGFEPGSVVRYTVVIENGGSGPATGLTFTDVLPEQLALLPDSIRSSGSGSSVDGTQVVFDDASGTLTVRIGDGAGPNGGGTLDAGGSLELTFDATIIETLPGCSTSPCVVSNQGVVEITGTTPGEVAEFETDGEPSTPSLDPTVFEVAVGCLSDDECSEALPLCDAGTCVACVEDVDCSGDASFCVDSTCVECREDADCPSPEAPNCNPTTNVCECSSDDGCTATATDTDGDGLSDEVEEEIGTDPEDADTDDDGLLDGDEPNPGGDTDGDGVIDALDVDSDNDGLLDGTETGTDCSHPDTDEGVCVPDADDGETKTDPADADTDDGGLQDGAEDFNLDGAIDDGETDPNDPEDDSDLADSDGDGLSDDLETVLRSDPNDADTDDDGVLDGDEPNPTQDDDGDGRTSVTDADSDNDGLFDGTEMGLGCDHEDTDPAARSCVPDADDGDTTTSPIDADTDDGGISDGSEDSNLNGRIDDGEGDPNDPSDDSDIADSDDDGLGDDLEQFLGTDPNDADTDDDGVLDGDEANPSQDLDGDGLYAASDPDSDGDLLYDGVEVGTDCSHPDSDPRICIVDADAGLTTSSPLWVDSDADGIADGVTDANWDGVIDETDELFVDGEIKGGGCACSAPRSGQRGSAGLLLGLAILALAGVRRRRHGR